jgi:predicted membrane protein
MSEVKLDLRYAAIPAGCTISVSAIMANVSLIVPPGAAVDFDVTPVMAATRNDARDVGSPGYREPHLHVRGSALMSEVRVRVRALGR